MKKEFKIVDEKNKIVRITTDDERFYFKPVIDKETMIPSYQPFPSTTWVCNVGYPKSSFLLKWREEVGTDEADRRKKEGGSRGSKVHYACEQIDRGEDIDIRTAKFLNPNNGQEEELTAEEIVMVMNYIKFREEKETTLLANELVSFSDITAGTIDKIFAFPTIMPTIRQIWIVDIKTAKNISREYELQSSDYSHMNIDYKKLGITDEEWKNRKIGILRLDMGVNHKWDLKEIEDCYDFFRNSVYPTWKDICGNTQPKQYELPLILKSEYCKSQSEQATKTPPDAQKGVKVATIVEKGSSSTPTPKTNKIKQTK
ncbi:MAG TPA: hypothetical protein VI795_02350 [Patescibacteria group bacterium]|nr:hypothetical protein [Patescibacteria group bacterium]